jgi:hypothetical protein
MNNAEPCPRRRPRGGCYRRRRSRSCAAAAAGLGRRRRLFPRLLAGLSVNSPALPASGGCRRGATGRNPDARLERLSHRARATGGAPLPAFVRQTRLLCNSGAEANEAALNSRGGRAPAGARDATRSPQPPAVPVAPSRRSPRRSGEYRDRLPPAPARHSPRPLRRSRRDGGRGRRRDDRDSRRADQGEGGVVVPRPGYPRDCGLADRRDLLLIFDEVNAGSAEPVALGTTRGRDPDIMTLAKALGGGLPIGAMCTTDRVTAALGVARATARPSAAIRSRARPRSRARGAGGRRTCRARARVNDHFHARPNGRRTGGMRAVRGMGLMLGAELDRPGVVDAPRRRTPHQLHGRPHPSPSRRSSSQRGGGPGVRHPRDGAPRMTAKSATCSASPT